jgi:hypothetical protein
MATTQSTPSNFTVRIIPNDRGNPAAKLADAELHFADGVLAGLKLIGFAIWERRATRTDRVGNPISGERGGRNVTSWCPTYLGRHTRSPAARTLARARRRQGSPLRSDPASRGSLGLDTVCARAGKQLRRPLMGLQPCPDSRVLR